MMNKKLLVTVFLMGISAYQIANARPIFPAPESYHVGDDGQVSGDVYNKYFAQPPKSDVVTQEQTQVADGALKKLGQYYLNQIKLPADGTVSQKCSLVLNGYKEKMDAFPGVRDAAKADKAANKSLTEEQNKVLAATVDGNFIADLPRDVTDAQNTYNDLVKCDHLNALVKVEGGAEATLGSSSINSNDKRKSSMPHEGVTIDCFKPASYTVDYESCLSAIKLFNAVVIADQGMLLEQGIRRDVKNKSIQEDATALTAKGDGQNAAIDAMNETKKHDNSLLTEKVFAYGAAVTALSIQYAKLPGEKFAIEKCQEHNPVDTIDSKCNRTVNDFKGTILANENAKSALAAAIMKFTAKATAAGLTIDKNMQAQAALGKMKKQYDDTPDMMLELCEYNPADPACTQRGPRVSGSGAMANGGLSFGGDGSSNSFDMNPAGAGFGDAGEATNLADDKNQVASINSPFKDAANEAKGILSPASEAKVQATGGAGGGGGGSGGGGGGGGSASLGGDLKGAQKEPSGDPQVKAGKVSGSYGAAGGGGYKGIGKGKEDKSNPFSSLFDQKGAAGGVEEDRTIASGDIDGKASGLFEKISSRYSKIKADKRIEAQNLE